MLGNRIDYISELNRELCDAELENNIVVSETTTLERVLKNGKWCSLRRAAWVQSKGSSKHQVQLRLILESAAAKAGVHGNQQCDFDPELGVGSVLPAVQGFGKIGYDVCAELKHNAGEVLILIFWREHGFDPAMSELHYLLEQGLTEQEGQVRVIAIYCHHTSERAQQIIAGKRWSNFKHFFASENESVKELIRMLSIGSYPTVCFVDKNGRITDTIGCDRMKGVIWYERVYDLLTNTQPMQAPRQRQQPNKLEQGQLPILSSSSWDKFENLLENISDLPGLTGVKLSTRRERSLVNGVTQVRVYPLTIRYRVGKQEAEAVNKVVEQLVSPLGIEEYRLLTYVNDVDIQTALFYKQAQMALSREGFEGSPIIRNTYQFNVRVSTDWELTSRQIHFPVVPVSGVEMRQKAMSLINSSNKVYENINVYAARSIGSSLVGQKFEGIRNLKTVEGSSSAIGELFGTVQIILFFPSEFHSEERKHQAKIQQAVRQAAFPVLLHLIFSQDQPYVAKQVMRTRPSECAILHFTDFKANQDTNIIGCIQPKSCHTLIVGPNATVLYCGEFKRYSELSQILTNGSFGSLSCERKGSQEPIELLKKIPEVTQRLRTDLASLDYEASLTLTFVESFSDLAMTSGWCSIPTLEYTIRDSDLGLLKPLLQTFQDAIVVENIIATKELPVGQICVQCRQQITLPYYYYFASNTHRCLQCASKQDREALEKLRRYPVMENSVLIFKDRNVDLTQFFLRRLPRWGEVVGEARLSGLLQIMTGNDEAQKQRLLKAAWKASYDAHRVEHPLLRILYRSTHASNAY